MALKERFGRYFKDMEEQLCPKDQKYFSISLPSPFHFPSIHPHLSKGISLTSPTELKELAISPSHRRLGLATKLLNIGLKKADEEGLACYLSASPMGVPLYQKCGFKEVGRLSIDLEEFGGMEYRGVEHVHVGMIRPPKGLEETKV